MNSPQAVSRSSGRTASVDVLRLVLAYMIVALHGHFLGDVAPRARYFLEEGLLRIAVPLFFMISGYFLQDGGWRGMRRWLGRLGWLYALWMAVYAAYWLPATPPTPAGAVFRAIFGYYQLWFLPALMMAGLLLFALRSCPRGCLALVAGVTAAAGLAIQYVGNWQAAGLLPGSELTHPYLFRNFLTFGLPFMAIGALLARHPDRFRLSSRNLGLIILAGLVLLTVENSLNLRLTGPDEPVELLLALYLLCPAILMATLRLRIAASGKAIAQLATGIYLVHTLFLMWLADHTGLGHSAAVLVTSVLSTGAAAVLVLVNRRVPVL